MGLPLSAYIHRSVLTDANGTQNEGVNAVAVYFWDSVSLSWVKASGGAIPGVNVNITNFPPIYPSSVADGANVVLGATTDAAVTTNTTGTVSGKLRGMVAILSSVWNSLINALKIQIISGGDTIDTGNSTTTPLLANATFTGPWTDILNYSQISFSIFTDQNSATNGLVIQFSSDGVNIDHQHRYTVLASVSPFFGDNFQLHPHARFYRLIYTNGPVNQTAFRLETVLHPVSGIGSIVEVQDTISGGDDAVITKAVITGQDVTNPANFINGKMTPDGGMLINQNIQIDANNSSIANLAVGATFTGATTSNITASMIQIFLKTDQNCLVYLDQSQDGINFDISDRFEFFAAIGNFGINVGAFGAFYRVRVTNTGVATTTFFRLQTIFVPIANQLPRTLSQLGWLQTQINHLQDDSGFAVNNTPFGEMTTVQTIKLVGSLFPGNTLDTAFWTAVIGTGGSVAPVNGLLTMQTGTTANNATSLTTINNARFLAGHTNRFRAVVVLPDTGVANNTRRGGAYTATDGVFYELAGTVFNLVTRKASVEARVANGSFNGILGARVALDTNTHTWEIVYTAFTIWYFYDGNLLHTSSFNTTWSSTLNLPITYENFNTGGSTTNVILTTFGATILRNGQFIGQPQHFFQSGLTAGQTLKIGPGGLQGMLISNVTNNANVTLYDSLTAAGTIIWQSGAMGAQTIPFSLDFKGISFNIGLVLVVAGAACNALVLYE